MNPIAQRILAIRERIDLAARSAGRDPAEVRLLVVTKTHPPEMVRAVIAAGAQHLGENYAEEALAKQPALADLPGVQWHMIGHVQSRKAEIVARHFDYLHALDSLKLAARLDRFAAAAGRVLPVLLECNVSGEASKFGYPAWQEAAWESLLPEFDQIARLPHLALRGLMTMPPFVPDPELARPCFQRLNALRAFLRRQLPQAHWDELSMGMSADFEVAVQEGATWVRVGQAIMGARPR